MSYVDLTHAGEVAVLTLHRGKVNAFNESFVKELKARLGELSADVTTRALILTGHGKFFSFGFDVPELYPLSKEDFTRFVNHFTELYTTLYLYPKPVIAALNGHTIAGGCMLAVACDRRLMAEGSAKISLNEITFGATVFAGSVDKLRACVGQRNAEEILLSGAMYGPEEALSLGLVDRVIAGDKLMPAALEEARVLASRDGAVFSNMKRLLRGPVVEAMRSRESESIREFVEIWYSESTREQLKGIEIRK
ncbi:MAG: enoyl-CoA hydratase/isomerase family protein [Candidatus Latescibacterota bacterium]|nr:MAG: enoyl-CoA hydratase/isomerase family protein [Candidatus Latescibacterota bacterium]